MSWTNIFATVSLGPPPGLGAAGALAAKAATKVAKAAGAGALAGGVVGESRVLGHIGDIEVLKFDWSMEARDKNRSKKLLEKGRANVAARQLKILKRFDTSSTALLKALKMRQPVEELKLTLARSASSIMSQAAHAAINKGEQALGDRGGAAAGIAEAALNSVAFAQSAYTFKIKSGLIKKIELRIEPVDQGVELQELVYVGFRELKVEYHPVSRQGQRVGAVTFAGEFGEEDK